MWLLAAAARGQGFGASAANQCAGFANKCGAGKAVGAHTRRMSTRKVVAFPGAILAFALTACAQLQPTVNVGGTEFSQVKVDRRGFVIGLLPEDTRIGDRLCKRGWAHVHPNGVVAAFTAAEPFAFGQLVVPAGTWVRQDDRGHITYCAFPTATLVQGHWCRGTGGPKGVTTSFYPSGALKQFFPERSVVIDGVPCRTGIFHGWVELHENGRLKATLLDAEFERGGRRYRRGTWIEFDQDGNVVPPLATPAERPVG